MFLTGLLYLFLAALSSALLAIFLRAFQSDTDNRYGIILGNYAACIVLGIVLMPDRTVILRPERATLLCGLFSGALYIINLILMQTSIRVSGAIMTSAFAKLGLVVPLVISIVWGHEQPGPMQWIGIALVFAAMYFINKGTEEERETLISAPKTKAAEDTSETVSAAIFENSGSSVIKRNLGFIVLITVLLVSGVTDTMAKVFERIGSRSQDGLYIFLVFLTAGLLALIMLVIEYRKTGRHVTRKSLLAGLIAGVPNYFSATFLLKALVKLPAFIVYPGFATGALLIVTLISTALFREKPGKMRLTGLCIILCALILLNI